MHAGSVQLYMSYPYTGTTSLKEGKWPDGNRVLWSRRVNLLQNVNMVGVVLPLSDPA